MDEIRRVILEAPKEKAPRPDGFIGVFFSACWEVIKEDLIKVVHHFFIQNQQSKPFEPSFHCPSAKKESSLESN
jgi:hypothetical protein